MASNIATLPVLDPTIREELELVGGAELLRKLVDMFFSDSAQLLQTIDTGKATDDSSSITKAAHRLKGGAAAVGALRVAAVAAQLELAAKEGQAGRLEDAREALDAELASLRSHLAG